MHDGNMQNKTWRPVANKDHARKKCDAPGTQCQLEGSIAHVLSQAQASFQQYAPLLFIAVISLREIMRAAGDYAGCNQRA
jgi:hypothetical protein